MNKRFSSLILASLLITSMSLVVKAEAKESITPVILNTEPTLFSVTVPTGLPIWLNSDGEVTTSNEVFIQNNSIGPVTIQNVSIEAQNG